MKKLTILTFIVLAFSFASAPEAAAQNRIGANVGYNLDAENLFIGGQFRFAPPTVPLTINPSAEYYLDVPGGSVWEFDINALYHIGRQYTTTFTPYFGAGLGIMYAKPENGDGNTDAGFNLVAGADFGMARIQPFVEARIQINDNTPVSIRGGLLFAL